MSEGGLSKVRLGRMHDVMAGFVERGEQPGLVTFVGRRGEEHFDAIGLQSAGGDRPMGRDTIFRFASLSKPVFAVAAMMLVEERRLRLDEPIDRLIPELAHRRVLTALNGPLDDTVAAHRPITLRDLLTQRMGFGSIMEPCEDYPIVRAVEERLRERIFDPLGMKDTSFTQSCLRRWRCSRRGSTRPSGLRSARRSTTEARPRRACYPTGVPLVTSPARRRSADSVISSTALSKAGRLTVEGFV